MVENCLKIPKKIYTADKSIQKTPKEIIAIY